MSAQDRLRRRQQQKANQRRRAAEFELEAARPKTVDPEDLAERGLPESEMSGAALSEEVDVEVELEEDVAPELAPDLELPAAIDFSAADQEN